MQGKYFQLVAASGDARMLVCAIEMKGYYFNLMGAAAARRGQRPFIYFSKPASSAVHLVNLDAMRDQLIESELLGHEKGAFTGAAFSSHRPRLDPRLCDPVEILQVVQSHQPRLGARFKVVKQVFSVKISSKRAVKDFLADTVGFFALSLLVSLPLRLQL